MHRAGAPLLVVAVGHDGLLLGASPRRLFPAGPLPALVLAAPDLRERFATLGAEPWVATAKELDNRVRLDFDRLGKVIKAAGIQPE